MTTTSQRIGSFALALLACAGPAASQPPRPADSTRSVTLSLNEYNRLIDLAGRPPQGSAAPPVPAVLSSADLKIRVEGEAARGVFALEGEVLRSGVSRVNLIAGATLIGATTAGRPLPLVADASGHAALLPGPGSFSLALEWGAALAYSPGRAAFRLPVPAAGTARATFDLPGEQADLRLSTGLVTRRSIVDGRTIVEATLDPGSITEVWWSMRDIAPVPATRDARLLGDVFTLVTIGDADVRMVGLIDVAVVQGEPRTIEVRLPGGYELTSVSGTSLETSEHVDGLVRLTVTDPALRRHQFLVSLERSHAGGSFLLDTGVPTLTGMQRERGEIAVEADGTLELTATEREGMHRIDVRELNAALRRLARLPLLTAFRYQRSSVATPSLALDVKRFVDAGVLAAIADRATATTLVTVEGRALTEVALQIRNRAQPFLKVLLPAGAAMLSVDVAGAPAKPVLGSDGIRVPLLRPGLRRTGGTYAVSFVYLHAGTPFARKGEIQMTLPKMDIPVGIVDWEVFAPDTYSVRAVGGNVLDRRLIDVRTDASRNARRNGAATGVSSGLGPGWGGMGGGTYAGGTAAGSSAARFKPAVGVLPGQIVGLVTDEIGAALPGVSIAVGTTGQTAVSNGEGAFVIAGVPSGSITLVAQLAGFQPQTVSLDFTQQPVHVDFELRANRLEESVAVRGMAPGVSGGQVAPSANVVNLQRRASGVLPVRIDVPRAGTSHQFVKPLVVDEETTVRLRYSRR